MKSAGWLKWSLASLIFISGCQTNPLPKDFYNNGPEDQLPPISYFLKKPNQTSTALCKEALCSRNGQLGDAIYRELAKSKMFTSITPYQNRSDYQLQVFATQTAPGDAKEFAKIMVSAATLFVVPMTYKKRFHGEFVVSWQGIPLAEYEFSIPYDETLYLFKDINQTNQFAAESLTARFLSTAQGENIFTSEYLYEKLKAEDYHRDLSAPNTVDQYVRSEMKIFPNPWFGAQLRYRNTAVREEICDVFVYPIRSVEWNDQNKAINEEMSSIRKDIDLAVKGAMYKSAQFSDTKPFTFKDGNQTYSGAYSSGTLEYASGEKATSAIYLFVKKDKFVKYRITTATSQPSNFEAVVTRTLPALTVPDESYFIATARQHHRKTTLQ